MNEAVAYLRNASPLNALVWNEKLEQAATFHTNDIGPQGLVQHDSSDGTSFSDRTRRYGSGGSFAENISFGPTTGYDVVMGLFIDDGVASRGHRDNLFGASWTQTANNSGTHQ